MANFDIEIHRQKVTIEVEPDDIQTVTRNEDEDWARHFLNQLATPYLRNIMSEFGYVEEQP